MFQLVVSLRVSVTLVSMVINWINVSINESDPRKDKNQELNTNLQFLPLCKNEVTILSKMKLVTCEGLKIFE